MQESIPCVTIRRVYVREVSNEERKLYPQLYDLIELPAGDDLELDRAHIYVGVDDYGNLLLDREIERTKLGGTILKQQIEIDQLKEKLMSQPDKDGEQVCVGADSPTPCEAQTLWRLIQLSDTYPEHWFLIPLERELHFRAAWESRKDHTVVWRNKPTYAIRVDCPESVIFTGWHSYSITPNNHPEIVKHSHTETQPEPDSTLDRYVDEIRQHGINFQFHGHYSEGRATSAIAAALDVVRQRLDALEAS